MNLTDYNEIRALLELNGFRFSKSMGQNFLTASWVPEEIAERAMLSRDTGVLEIGPGIGCLTVQLSKRAGKVVSIEIDKRLKPVLAVTLGGCDNTEVVFADALKLDLHQLVEASFLADGLRPVVCANLPYNVTSPILTKLISSGLFSDITVMIQREVARRICASAGEQDYSAFGVFVQWYTQPEMLFDVPPSCFIPQPKVTSTVIRLKRRSSPPCEVQDEAFMFSLIRASFIQRRKTLLNAVSSNVPGVSKEKLEAALKSCGLDSRVRGEALPVESFARLSDLLLQ